jgi:hypothetical protein
LTHGGVIYPPFGMSNALSEENVCKEKHDSVNALAILWNMSKQTIRRLFQDEADIVRIGEG